MALDRTVAVHQQHVHGPFLVLGKLCGGFIVSRPDGQITHTVAVQVTQAGQSAAKAVESIQSARCEASETVADLSVGLYRAVTVHEEQVHGPFRGVVIRPDGQIGDAVAVQVTQAGH